MDISKRTLEDIKVRYAATPPEFFTHQTPEKAALFLPYGKAGGSMKPIIKLKSEAPRLMKASLKELKDLSTKYKSGNRRPPLSATENIAPAGSVYSDVLPSKELDDRGIQTIKPDVDHITCPICLNSISYVS